MSERVLQLSPVGGELLNELGLGLELGEERLVVGPHLLDQAARRLRHRIEFWPHTGGGVYHQSHAHRSLLAADRLNALTNLVLVNYKVVSRQAGYRDSVLICHLHVELDHLGRYLDWSANIVLRLPLRSGFLALWGFLPLVAPLLIELPGRWRLWRVLGGRQANRDRETRAHERENDNYTTLFSIAHEKKPLSWIKPLMKASIHCKGRLLLYT